MRRIHQLREKIIDLALVLGVAGGMYILGLPCPILHFTGIRCPGCGMTRAWLRALRLDLAGAMELHGMFWALPVLAMFFLLDGKLFPKKWMNAGALGLLAAGFLANWLLG